MNQDQNKVKIVLTGGHAATTALSVIEELVRKSKKDHYWDIYWIGARKAIEGKGVPTLSSSVFPKLGISFHPVIAGRVQRKFTRWTLPSILKIPLGLFHSLLLLIKIKPKIILSFGGFAAFPIVVGGWLLRIPIVIHEQTAVVGRANRMSSFFAKSIAVARKSSIKYFPKDKSIITGNPILTEITTVAAKNKISPSPVIYITGGSTGAKAINNLIEPIIGKLLKKYFVIHQTGLLDFKKFKSIKKGLPKKLRSKYEVYSIIDPTEIDGVFKRADIIISRAGANTVAEIIATKRPAILIPLPIAYLNEQMHNALYAKKFGIAKVLSQEDLNSEKLFNEVEDIKRNYRSIVAKVRDKKSADIDAAKKLVSLLEKDAISEKRKI